MVLLLSSLSSLFLLLKLSHNESVMPEIWCEIEKGKFFVFFDCGVLISNSV